MRWKAACTMVRRSSIERRRVPKPHPMKKRKTATKVSRKLYGSWPLGVEAAAPAYVAEGVLEEEDAVEAVDVDMVFVRGGASWWWVVRESGCEHERQGNQGPRVMEGRTGCDSRSRWWLGGKVRPRRRPSTIAHPREPIEDTRPALGSGGADQCRQRDPD